jgi:hypothetical protein
MSIPYVRLYVGQSLAKIEVRRGNDVVLVKSVGINMLTGQAKVEDLRKKAMAIATIFGVEFEEVKK